MKFLIGLLLCVGMMFGQSGVKIVDGTNTERILGASGKAFDSNPNGGLTTITTGGVTITSVTTKVQVIHCNTNSSTSTVTIADGSSNNYLNAVSVAANSVLVIVYGPIGMTYTGGIVITAGTSSALTCRVIGVQ